MKTILTEQQFKKYLEMDSKEVHSDYIKKEEPKVKAVEK